MTERHAIWEKEDHFVEGDVVIWMDPSVVELPDMVPLTFGFNGAGEPIGRVSDIRLEDDQITCSIEIFEEQNRLILPDILKMYRLGGYYTNVQRNDDGDRVISAILREVSFVAKQEMYGNPEKTDG